MSTSIGLLFSSIPSVSVQTESISTSNKLHNKQLTDQSHREFLPFCQPIFQMPYTNCDKTQHVNEPMSVICIDQSCKKQALICSICQNQEHFQHDTIPLKIYLNEVFGHLYKKKQGKYYPQTLYKSIMQEKFQDIEQFGRRKQRNSQLSKNNSQNIYEKQGLQGKQNQKNVLYYTNQIDNMKKSYLNTISQLRQSILQTFHQLQTIAIQYFNAKQQLIRKVIKIEDSIEIVNKSINKINQNENILQSKAELKKLRNHIQNMLTITNLEEQFNISEKLKEIIEKSSKIIQISKTNLEKSHKIFEDSIYKQIETIKQNLKKNNEFQKYSTKIQFKFSDNFRGTKMFLTDSNTVAEQTGMQSSGQRFSLLEPSFFKTGKKSQGPFVWGIRILKLVGWIGVGIALKNVIVKANYGFLYSTIGHGSYMISSNGYCWSNSDINFNSIYKSFTFTTNDIILMKYDPVAKKLKFLKNLDSKTFELDIIDPPANDEYCPCVNICSNGDKVQVINNIVNIDFDK